MFLERTAGTEILTSSIPYNVSKCLPMSPFTGALQATAQVYSILVLLPFFKTHFIIIIIIIIIHFFFSPHQVVTVGVVVVGDDISNVGWIAAGFSNGGMRGADIMATTRNIPGNKFSIVQDYGAVDFSVPFLDAQQDVVSLHSGEGVFPDGNPWVGFLASRPTISCDPLDRSIVDQSAVLLWAFGIFFFIHFFFQFSFVHFLFKFFLFQGAVKWLQGKWSC